MSYQPYPHASQQLHEFPLSPKLEAFDFVDLARQARERFAAETILTRLEVSETLSYGTNQVLVKSAYELPGGTFKFLSAGTAIAELSEDGHSEFVLGSAGSYMISAGHAVSERGGHVTAFMPIGSSPAKQAEGRELGVFVVEAGNNFDEALGHARRYAKEQGAKLVHPFASLANLAGTGILGLQLVEECPDMTDLVLQWGGGSLAVGVSSVVKQLLPGVRVRVVQVAGCSPFVDSVRSGRVQESTDVQRRGKSYFAKLGGVGVGRTHPLTLGLGSQLVDEVATTPIDHVYATMHDVGQDPGKSPEFAAAVGQNGARDLARTHGVNGAKIVAVHTGCHPEVYQPGYLAATSSRRQEDERRRGMIAYQ